MTDPELIQQAVEEVLGDAVIQHDAGSHTRVARHAAEAAARRCAEIAALEWQELRALAHRLGVMTICQMDRHDLVPATIREEFGLKKWGGIAAVYGQWPGDETDAQIADAMNEEAPE